MKAEEKYLRRRPRSGWKHQIRKDVIGKDGRKDIHWKKITSSCRKIEMHGKAWLPNNPHKEQCVRKRVSVKACLGIHLLFYSLNLHVITNPVH
jgi:hypothetical protein